MQPLEMHHQIFIAIFTAFWLAAGSIAHAGDRSAVAVVEDLHGSLLAMMKKADVLGFEGRLEFMEPVVARSFNLQLLRLWLVVYGAYVCACAWVSQCRSVVVVVIV